MPRGVYDRSKIGKKSEEKAAAPKGAKTPKAVKAKGQAKAQRALQSAQSGVAQEVMKELAGEATPGLKQLGRGLVDTFDLARTTETLLHIRTVVSSGTATNGDLVESIDVALEKIVKKLDSSLTDVEEKAAEVVEQAPAPAVIPAPVAAAPIAQPQPTFAPAPVSAPIPFNPPPSSVQ